MDPTRLNPGELDVMLADLEQQSALYRPTPFWAEASARIVAEVRERGLHEFRRLPSALGFFVPTYGSPTNAFTADQNNGLRGWLAEKHPEARKQMLALEQFLDGATAALADYRVLQAADDPARRPYLHLFSESTVGNPVEQFEFDGRRFSRSALNYLLGLALLKRHLGSEPLGVVLEVGGGFGTLGEILLGSAVDGVRYVDLDIPPTALAAQFYLASVFGESRVATYAQTRRHAVIDIDALPMASVLCSWQIERLRGSVDLFVNFISFQEMEPPVVKNYLDQVRRLRARWILLRNLREGKQRRSDHAPVGVDTPILGDDYTAMLPEYELVARNLIPFGHRTVDNFHSELLLLRLPS